jgi:hypothetical protein
VIDSILSIFAKNSNHIKFVNNSQFENINLSSFQTLNDQEILSTICNAVDLPAFQVSSLSNKINDHSICFPLEEFVGASFMERLTDYIIFFTKKLQKNENELDIESDDDEEEDEDEDQDSGLTLCKNNIQSLIKLVFYRSKFDKKMIFKFPEIIQNLIENLKSGSTSDNYVFTNSNKQIISNVIHQICSGFTEFSHIYKQKVSQQICFIAFSFWDCCKGEGLSHLISQLRPNNVKRNNLSR